MGVTGKVPVEEPSESVTQKIAKDLGECEERLRHDEEIIHNWIKYQSHFPKNYDKAIVRGFLRTNKLDVQRTKRKLESYFQAKAHYPEIFSDRDPSSISIQKVVQNLNIAILPKLTENGEGVVIATLTSPDPEAMDVISGSKFIYMCYDLILQEARPFNGALIVLDGKYFGGGHFVKFVSSSLKANVKICRDIYSIRLKGVYVINAPPGVDKMISIAKSLLSEKLSNRFAVSKGTELLEERFPKDMLPSDYGGTLKPLSEIMLTWLECLKRNASWFKDQETVKIEGGPDESSDKNTCFGFENGIDVVNGSFRKLAID